ncbi:MAG: hypothetical protein FJ406_03115 [Verrucomicrobia bacterium]|nr:hypothetical protein [Verrucomicrobiota bacterium]
MRLRILGVLGGLLLCFAGAEEGAAADKLEFQRDVLPIFETKCLRCHGEKKRDGKLDLRTVDAMLKGGVTSPVIQPGNAQKSLLIELLHYNEMPPKKENPRVTKEELELLRKWINAMPVPPTASPK